jgi:hypothetical protein
MTALLLLLPVALYLAWRPVRRLLRSLPDSNDDFILF